MMEIKYCICCNLIGSHQSINWYIRLPMEWRDQQNWNEPKRENKLKFCFSDLTLNHVGFTMHTYVTWTVKQYSSLQFLFTKKFILMISAMLCSRLNSFPLWNTQLLHQTLYCKVLVVHSILRDIIYAPMYFNYFLQRNLIPPKNPQNIAYCFVFLCFSLFLPHSCICILGNYILSGGTKFFWDEATVYF